MIRFFSSISPKNISKSVWEYHLISIRILFQIILKFQPVIFQVKWASKIIMPLNLLYIRVDDFVRNGKNGNTSVSFGVIETVFPPTIGTQNVNFYLTYSIWNTIKNYSLYFQLTLLSNYIKDSLLYLESLLWRFQSSLPLKPSLLSDERCVVWIMRSYWLKISSWYKDSNLKIFYNKWKTGCNLCKNKIQLFHWIIHHPKSACKLDTSLKTLNRCWEKTRHRYVKGAQ